MIHREWDLQFARSTSLRIGVSITVETNQGNIPGELVGTQFVSGTALAAGAKTAFSQEEPAASADPLTNSGTK